MSIMLDSGTTTLAIARKLRIKRSLTVITTSLPIASELFGFDNVRLLLLGGFLQHDSPDLTGALTESNLEALHADIAFVGADGVDDKGNVYNRQPALGRMIGKMAESSQQVYVVADHSKLGGRALVRYGNLKDYTALITDAGGKSFAGKLKRKGINVETA
jgi:DeoR/GlpR family transcriptional regulator of sugar metabolism